MAAEDVLGPDIMKVYCCVDLLPNLVKIYRKETEQFFWPIANAILQEQYHSALQAFHNEKPLAAAFLFDIPPVLWVTAFFPATGIQCGYVSSNIVEVVNSLLQSEQQLLILDLWNEIWLKVMNQYAQRLSATQTAL